MELWGIIWFPVRVGRMFRFEHMDICSPLWVTVVWGGGGGYALGGGGAPDTYGIGAQCRRLTRQQPVFGTEASANFLHDNNYWLLPGTDRGSRSD